ncbi:hypothetical protein LMG6871_02329 [Ralstonia edaphis]|uniref:hypothetical protein n=1 Tax=Ralstonia edaphi TaxID=3058599 RepID=UPI0028F6A16B|nr:hypothetical protein [Ralstonia sp. LMG 6871]CAJ0718065.1 hypothetical protein LMG6871_02329 [Ralstonia sp. LMG 6871]
MKSVRHTALPWLLGAACAVYGATAFAADCTTQFSDGTVDFGMMRPGTGKDAGQIRPSAARRIYTASCAAPAQMNLVFRGTAAGADGALQFGHAGTYSVRVLNALLDGAPVQLVRVPAVGMPPSEAHSGELELKPNDIVAPANGQQLLSGTRLDVTLQISVSVPADAIRIAQQVTLRGTSQISLEAR